MRCTTLMLRFGALALLVGSAQVAQAVILNIDLSGFDTTQVEDTHPAFTGNGVLRADGSTNTDPGLGTTSGTWNSSDVSSLLPNTPVPASGFLDSSGGAGFAGVTIALSGSASADDCPGCVYGASANTLLRDYVYTGGTIVLTIGGLSANTPYDLYVYSTNNGSSAGGDISVNGSASQLSTGTDSGFTIYKDGVNYVDFLGVSTNGLGQLVVSVGQSGSPAFTGVLNGFQLVQVPEPSSFVMLAFSTLFMGFMKGRRRN